MRTFVREHSATLMALAAMLCVAGIDAAVVSAPTGIPGGGSVSPRMPVALPGIGEDLDNDTYADALDTTDGDLLLRIRLLALAVPGGEPFVLAGTQQDHGRTGKAAELEWQHVVDPDPLGRRAGSTSWADAVLRTGSWVSSIPMEGEARAIAQTDALANDSKPAKATWPQELVLNVRDDVTALNLTLELWDVSDRPFRRPGAWTVEIDLAVKQATVGGAGAVALGSTMRLEAGRSWLEVAVEAVPEIPNDVRLEVAERWAPSVRFDSDERFFPVRGDAMERYHGFYGRSPDLRTWGLSFSNGRDVYRLLLADLNGDRRIDHRDAAGMADFLSEAPIAAPTLYANVASAANGAVVVQYWFLYFYNFVVGEDLRDIEALAHDGDREFVQLQFKDLDAALNGTPEEIVFGRHYEGTRVTDPGSLLRDGLTVYVAHGSHALYPTAGDDRDSRPALAGFFDTFDGEGRTWTPGNYSVELLTNQPWHAGYLWGPATRFGRDFGTSTRPLLQHDFRYPFTDPLYWAAGLPALDAEDAIRLYGGDPE